MELYYGICRIEKPSNLKASTDYLTSIGTASSPSTLKTSISTTKYFMIRLKGDGWTTIGSQDSSNFLFNKKASKYPEYTCPKSGKYAVPPYYTNFKAERLATWNTNDRNNYIKWFNATYNNGKDPWNWDEYQVHHIRPLSWGGLSDYGNLVPLKKTIHPTWTTWWLSY